MSKVMREFLERKDVLKLENAGFDRKQAEGIASYRSLELFLSSESNVIEAALNAGPIFFSPSEYFLQTAVQEDSEVIVVDRNAETKKYVPKQSLRLAV